MAVFDLTIALLVIAALLARLARWLQVPYPSLLALARTAVAFVPGAPRAALDPTLALALFVAPTLLDAAFDASPRDPSAALRRVVARQRNVLGDLRRSGQIGDDAFHAVEEEIDLLELSADPRLRPPRRVGPAPS